MFGTGLKRTEAFLLACIFLTSLAWAGEFELAAEDEQFLDLVGRKAFDYFRDEHHPETGLVKDKSLNGAGDTNTIASIAATGFGLTAMCIGAERVWIPKDDVYEYCLKTLRFFRDKMVTEHGFHYHFVNWSTGKPTKYSEVSSIDTALFLAGALTAGEYFEGTDVERLAAELYERADFPWMLNNGKTLCMGWKPDEGFLKMRWDNYDEALILYLLAVASPTHPVPADSWAAVKKKIGMYGPYIMIFSPPLFTHQYSQCWMDLRNKNDGVADYFENSRIATLANRQFCIDQREKFKTYSENIWGLTASLGPNGYKAYGAAPDRAVHDGTVAPTAAGGSIVFTPEFSVPALKEMHAKFKSKLWGKYGFGDAFNVDRDWFSNEVLGIDQGPILLMIENLRTEFVWRLFGATTAQKRGLELMGFREGPLELKRPKGPSIRIPERKREIVIDGDLEEWDFSKPVRLRPDRHHEIGTITGEKDLSGDFSFVWDGGALYMAGKISDESLVMNREKDKIWKDDCVELFIDPAQDGLVWNDPKDIQLGVSPAEGATYGKSWAWFQGYDPQEQGLMDLKIRRKAEGYDVEVRIAWKFLQVDPAIGTRFGLSVVIHDADQDRAEGKLNLFFLPDGKRGGYFLGRAVLKE